MNKFYVGVLGAVASLSISGVALGATISCDMSGSETAKDTVVLFVNGIRNDVSDAENSRVAISTALGAECNNSNCSVQKYYNNTDGFLGTRDVVELNKVAALERDAANSALIEVVAKAIDDGQRLIGQSNSAQNQLFTERESDVLNSMLDIQIDAFESSDANSEVEYPFKDYGTRITDYIIERIDSDGSYTDTSAVIKMLNVRKRFYNNHFRNNFTSTLRNNYLSNRAFYGDSDKAMAAVTKSVEGLTTYLEENVLSGKRVVVVAHSQGNHVVELAHTVLAARLSISQLQAMRFIGAASVAATSPNNVYISWDDDHTINKIHDYLSDSQPTQPTFLNGEGNSRWDLSDHNFNSVYMSDELKGNYSPAGGSSTVGVDQYLVTQNKHSMKDWMVGLIKGGIDQATPVYAELSADGFITTTLRWETYPDMDLHTREPNSNIVYFSSKTGVYGELDKDDTDGIGPEHYTSNVTCSQASNKEWAFGIHQYPSGGSSEVAHLSIKVGGQHVSSNSYSNSSWPSGVVWLGNVSFDSYNSSNNTISFDVTLANSIQ
ncbi:hypothetical protein AB4455_10485 [Vibrio sp. 10N.261.46.E12]|uniref:hypothetical protein n=1 Tax=unclassified Vibrio TaxID=2614977 RepID=UPI0009773ECF|nr:MULTISPECIES: hypothetical protein [unclassified Vibrio]OMO36105.1 hypothetical protein BH584_04845 [Vibrio sp. 10N.261.45.E1]PMJ34543.1 hypothetical protein BCU27_03690 [Vibrio sp. 10N.286.45.B6]PML88071.1 hypothetical protein BCT66_10760 [Vibrio sp. 10N.261.49.E11]PMM67399.1 hypothetical protein BCT48_15235 [Vibrio sp. 10N.261.46.F12]PMM81718.1 hypothetical protein BCT46_15025 [Vibrio sp. 10N.261.46.E8]